MIIYSIYKCVNKTNGKVYIGFDSNWPNRKRIHKCNYLKINYKFYNALKKYGWDNFEWDVIYQSRDRDYTLNIMERHFIEYYDSFKNGYNSTLGGQGVFGVSRKQSEEEKNKRKIIMKGNSYGSLSKGRILTEEQKQKLSLLKKGKPQPKMQCIHCKFVGSISGVKRYHLNNCKLKV
jgi:group I intron endonuclease